MIIEALRVLWQVTSFACHSRRFGVWLLVVVGLLAVVLALGASMAAPVLVYPLL